MSVRTAMCRKCFGNALGGGAAPVSLRSKPMPLVTCSRACVRSQEQEQAAGGREDGGGGGGGGGGLRAVPGQMREPQKDLYTRSSRAATPWRPKCPPGLLFNKNRSTPTEGKEREEE